MNTTPRYAELHCLSNFTFLRGASHPHELILRAEALGYEALAITDECSMAGVVRAYEATKKNHCRLRLIVGSELRTSDGMHLVLLAPTQAAYAQICTLISLARQDSPKGQYRLHRSQLEAHLSECLVLWIAPPEALISQAGWLRGKFPGRCWIAVELHRNADDRSRLDALRRLSASSGIPLVAAGDVHMHARERCMLQDTLTAIRHGCTVQQAGHRLLPNAERHLRSLQDLQTLYPADLLAESVHIAGLCRFSLGSLQYRYPNELVPQGITAREHLRQLTEEGLKYRWPDGLPEKFRLAVEKELALIAEMGYEHFFLTVHELVEFARSQDILCQGRGSAANSIVCYALRITEVNPALIDTLFERFISRERNEPPDIDVDFEHERREEVIQHVYEKYGRARAALAATVITYRVRSAIRDVGKALGIDVDIIDRLAKSHAWWDTWDSFFASLQQQGLPLEAGVGRRLHQLIKELRGFPRHLSQHVGGFVIAEEPISQLVPIENAAMPERTIIQWDKNDLETLGLLKVDVLALGMLTAIRRSFDLLKRAKVGPCSMSDVPREDPQTYDMICRADTIGVFQIESRAQMSMLPRLRPRNYYDLVIEIAIVRPGPIKGGMVHPYLKRRSMREEDIPYASEDLRPILKKTRGVPIFQEQVMQIAIKAAGFTPGEADELRRAMGSWERSGTMSSYQQKLMDGMLARNYSQEFAESIYKQIEGFGEYGFPESHSASFALLTYISSWLKCHRPAAFFAGLINSQPMGFYQPAQLLQQARRQGLEVLPIDVNASEWDCTLEPDSQGNHAIRLGLRLVRGLREPESTKLVAARADGPFFSVRNVADRTSLPQRALRTLALGGVFRSITDHRNIAFWTALGTEHLPGMLDKAAAADRQVRLPAPSEAEEILRDYRQLGFSTGRHPLALLRSRLFDRGIVRRCDLESLGSGSKVSVSGLVTHLQHPQTAKGVIFASLEDETGINNIIFWPDVFNEFRHLILQSNLMSVAGELQSQDGVIHIVAERVEDLTRWVRSLPRNSRDFH